MFIFAIQIIEIMKKGIHPENYRLVVMQDISTGHTVLTKSTANTKDTIKWDLYLFVIFFISKKNRFSMLKMKIPNLFSEKFGAQ